MQHLNEVFPAKYLLPSGSNGQDLSFLSTIFQHSQRVCERQDKRKWHSPEEHHQKVGDCLKSNLQPRGLAPCPSAAFGGGVQRTGNQDGQAATKQPGSLSIIAATVLMFQQPWDGERLTEVH